MKSYGYIYITTNLLNGKKYIGQSKWDKRLSETAYIGSGRHLKEAIKKYGREVFTTEVIFEAFSQEDLNWAERHIIEREGAVKSRNYYNISPGGRASLGFTGKKHTIERDEAVSQKLMGHPVNEHTRKAVSKTGKRTSIKLNSTKIVCPHCLKGGNLGPMRRWHFDRCKLITRAKTPFCG